MKTWTSKLLMISVLLLLPAGLWAEEDDAWPTFSGVSLKLQKQVTNPLPVVLNVKLQNFFIPSHYERKGYSNRLVLKPVIPISFDNFTDIVFRPTLPILVTTPNGTFGMGDLLVVQVFILPFSGEWGRWAVGPSLSFPTATHRETGTGKWTAGATSAVIIEKFKRWQIGVVVRNLTSYAGDSSRHDINALSIQPILAYHLPGGWFVGLGRQPTIFNWERGGAATVVAAVAGGKVFKVGSQPVALSLSPFYTPIHDGPTPKWGFQFTWTMLFPNKYQRDFLDPPVAPK